MNVAPIDLVVIVAFFVVAAYTAYLALNTKTFSQFSVANRSVPTAMIFASLAAAIVGPGFSIGFTAKGFASGYAYYLLALTYPLQTIVTGVFLAPRLHRFKNCHTLGEVMRERYGATAHALTGMVSVGLCIGFAAVMAKVGGLLVASVTGWPTVLCMYIVTFVTASYTFRGGIRASIATDAMYFVVKTILIPAMLIVAYLKTPNLETVVADAAHATAAGLREMSPMTIAAVAVSFLLGEMLIPPFANRALAAESSKASAKGFVMAGIYCIPWLAAVSALGVYARHFIAPSTQPDEAFLVLARVLLPAGVFGLILAALIAVVMSSQDSVINAGAVALTRDLAFSYTRQSARRSLIVGRFGTLVIAIIAATAAAFSPSIIDGLLVLYSVWAPSMLVPLIAALFLRHTAPAAGCLAIGTGFVLSLLWQSVLHSPMGIPAILVALPASAVAFAIGTLIHDQVPTPAEVVS